MDDVICPPLSISSIVVSLWLAGYLAKSTVTGWRKYYGGGGLGVDRHLCGALQTPGFDLMWFQYWPTANGGWTKIETSSGHLYPSAFGYTAFGNTRAVCVWLEQATQSSVQLTASIAWNKQLLVFGFDIQRQTAVKASLRVSSYCCLPFAWQNTYSMS